MALILCSECSGSLSTNAASCPHCGNPILLDNDVVWDVKQVKIKVNKTKTLQTCSTICSVGCFTIVVFIIIISHASKEMKTNLSLQNKTNEAVENSAWDGSVWQIKDWLNNNLKDPASLEIIEWSSVQKVKASYIVRVKYRAKNSFGGHAIENKLFFLDLTGKVLYSENYSVK